MPVENAGQFFPVPNITVEQPEGPVSVEFDDGTSHTGLSKVEDHELSDDHSESQHTPRSTEQFDVPGPVSVVVEGYGVKGESTDAAVQAKTVKPAAKAPAKKTNGAEGK